MRADLAIAFATAVVCSTAAAAAAAPEPSRAHPRLFLDDKIRATWKKQVGKDSAIAAAVGHCNASKRGGRDFTNDRYMGFLWSSNLQACLIAWAATGEDDHAKVAVKWFDALLDDLENVGDGKGGDNTIRRDSGYAIRLIGPTTALAYDWLHDHPAMGEARLAKARGRFKAWLDWYIKDGYRPRSPSTNYHAGYLVSATFMAIAQAGDAGADGTKLWKHVVDDLWRGDMVKALTGKGPLVGGDWGEGWQYAPLSVAGYALAGRAMQENGVPIDGMNDWLTALVVRHVPRAVAGRPVVRRRRHPDPVAQHRRRRHGSARGARRRGVRRGARLGDVRDPEDAAHRRRRVPPLRRDGRRPPVEAGRDPAQGLADLVLRGRHREPVCARPLGQGPDLDRDAVHQHDRHRPLPPERGQLRPVARQGRRDRGPRRRTGRCRR